MRDVFRPRLLLLLPTTTYRAGAFVRAADALDVQLTVASEEDSAFSTEESDKFLTLDFTDPAACVAHASAFHRDHRIDAVFGIDDRTAIVAAYISDALNLSGNPVGAVEAAGDKSRQRELLARAGVPSPRFECHESSESKPASSTIPFPAILKPVSLSASRGVMRVDDRASLVAGLERLGTILQEAAPPDERSFLIEEFVPGREYALEGLLEDGRLTPLALFDKPDPLEGPFFAETIYLTPSRSPDHVQQALVSTAQAACSALGLIRGPVHIELRYNEAGPWLVELAARPIGGRCGEVLRFGTSGEDSLETILLAHALGQLDRIPEREPDASGVMMIPVPRGGVFEEFRGVDPALATAGVTDIAITIHRGATVAPLPEEARYLGFIFARAADAGVVETALRTAFDQLEIVVR